MNDIEKKALALVDEVREIEGIRKAGGVAVVVNEGNWDMLPELVRKLKRGTSIIATAFQQENSDV